MNASAIEPRDRLIFALDVPDRETALPLVERLDGAVGCIKVGLQLFISEGPAILQAIRDHSDVALFLDLKLHDIPATVEGALTSVARHGVRFITVHCDEGAKLLRSVSAVADDPLDVLAVTVLTSQSENDLESLGFRPDLKLQQLVLDRARLAQTAGCAGVVCSGEEVLAIRQACGPDLLIVVPGIRPAWSTVGQDDQSRIHTPEMAITAGADYLVVGRPIRTAPDPRSAALRIVEEIEQALHNR